MAEEFEKYLRKSVLFEKPLLETNRCRKGGQLLTEATRTCLTLALRLGIRDRARLRVWGEGGSEPTSKNQITVLVLLRKEPFVYRKDQYLIKILTEDMEAEEEFSSLNHNHNLP